EKAAPAFEWRAYFAALGAPRLQDFYVGGLSYFVALDSLLRGLSVDDARAYLTVRWYEAANPDASDPGAGRPAFCANVVGFLMADAFETRFDELAGVDDTAQRKARAMFRAVVREFDAELAHDEPFLDDATRIEARTKLAKLSGAIARSPDL